MFRFAFPFFLWLLLLLPIFIMVFVWRIRWKKKAIKRFGELHLMDRLLPDHSFKRLRVKFVLMCCAFVFMVIGLSDPQIGSRYEEVKRKGIDLMLVLDVSNSMMAEDIKPNRLDRAKQSISRLLDKLGDDRLGIVVFAGDAMLQLPFTSDFAAAKMFLASTTTQSIQTQGTAIGSAIELAARALPKGNNRSKAIIVLSDGENHEDDAIAAAKAAREKKIFVYTIGIGTPEGAPIPALEESGSDGFKRDEAGNPIVTAMNPEMLTEVAKAGGGKFVQATNSDIGLDALVDEIAALKKHDFGTKTFTDYEDRFQYFIAGAIMLLIIELLISERKGKWTQRFSLFGKKERI
jgi:Ca-activated chloride channel family protein